MRKKWVINDWAGNRLWGEFGSTDPNLAFNSFEEAWDFIYVTKPEPEEGSPEWVDGWYDDYFVVEMPS